jgi:hypothetical protein
MLRLAPALVLFVALPVACELTTDLSPLDDGQCAAGSKACTNREGTTQCVGETDPGTSCGERTCLPCTARLDHVKTAICDAAGLCQYGTCKDGYAHCTTNRLDGCETYVYTDINHCGDCTRVCQTVPQATPLCNPPGNCVLLCKRGYFDCNGIYDDGCEESAAKLLIDSNNCGTCGTKCVLPTAKCAGGVCM